MIRFVNLNTQISDTPEFSFWSETSNCFYSFNGSFKWSSAVAFAKDYKIATVKNPKWRLCFSLTRFLSLLSAEFVPAQEVLNQHNGLEITEVYVDEAANIDFDKLKEFVTKPVGERLPYSRNPNLSDRTPLQASFIIRDDYNQ